MKNIYIVGVPRTGKTTLAKMIKERYPELNLISFEAIRNGFIKSQPNLNMENRNSIARKEILPCFLFEFIHWNNIISNYGNLIEGSFSDIKTIVKYINDQDIIICLGFNKRNINEIITGIMKNDTNHDYTKEWTEEKIKRHFYDICEEDTKNFNYCNQYNIKYYDTYQNRNTIFLEILNDIEKELISSEQKNETSFIRIGRHRSNIPTS